MDNKPILPVSEGARSASLPRVLVATTAMLTFISFWRAAAIVLNDLASSAYYAGGEAERLHRQVGAVVHPGDHAVFLLRARDLHGKLQHVRARRRVPRGERSAGRHARQNFPFPR